jgi:putative Ca2+/H+ antiporter (TMEM165/GDT1 family)
MEGAVLAFTTILIAELFDKSQLSLILLSTRTNKYLQLFLGALSAFIIVDGLAVLAGSYVTTLLPQSVLQVISGSIFILFGLMMLITQIPEQKEKTPSVRNAFFLSFTVIFLSEWGDKTQLATGILATQHNPYFVFMGVITAFTVLSFIAIYLGQVIEKYMNKNLLNKISGLVFILLGILFLFSN